MGNAMNTVCVGRRVSTVGKGILSQGKRSRDSGSINRWFRGAGEALTLLGASTADVLVVLMYSASPF